MDGVLDEGVDLAEDRKLQNRGEEDVRDWDEQDLLLKNLVIPTEKNIEEMQVGAHEPSGIENAGLIEASVMSMYVIVGCFAMEVARTRVCAAIQAKEDQRERAKVQYQRLSSKNECPDVSKSFWRGSCERNGCQYQ